MATAELDNEIKSQRVRSAMTEKYKGGDWMWAAPFGYTRTKRVVESELKPNQNESELVKKIFSMAAEGVSVGKITKHFAESDGLPKDVASPIAVERIISNPFYKGYMKSSLVPELVKGNYSPLVTVSLWEQANNNIRN
jgi:DNA invertase Pin-like site-specific DNA recombinase